MRSFQLDVSGPVHVADYGGSGPTLLLVHGLGGSHVNWLSVGSSLAKGHRVLAVDLPGFGRTPIAGRSATMSAHSAVLAETVAQLADPELTLIGNSMGGLLSMAVAA